MIAAASDVVACRCLPRKDFVQAGTLPVVRRAGEDEVQIERGPGTPIIRFGLSEDGKGRGREEAAAAAAASPSWHKFGISQNPQSLLMSQRSKMVLASRSLQWRSRRGAERRAVRWDALAPSQAGLPKMRC